jgi:hypothetical protein
MCSTASNWKIYRTRFLIKAKQLDAPLVFTDPLGREHSGSKGDYLVESSDGLQRIAPREIFEDIYVPMGKAGAPWPSPSEPGNNFNEGQLNQQQLQQPQIQQPQLQQSGLNSRRSSVNRSFIA